MKNTANSSGYINDVKTVAKHFELNKKKDELFSKDIKELIKYSINKFNKSDINSNENIN